MSFVEEVIYLLFREHGVLSRSISWNALTEELPKLFLNGESHYLLLVVLDEPTPKRPAVTIGSEPPAGQLLLKPLLSPAITGLVLLDVGVASVLATLTPLLSDGLLVDLEVGLSLLDLSLPSTLQLSLKGLGANAQSVGCPGVGEIAQCSPLVLGNIVNTLR